MHPYDEDKTAFMAETTNYWYRVVPFVLKNARVTYQWLIDKILQPVLGRSMEAYVNNIVVKLAQPNNMLPSCKEF